MIKKLVDKQLSTSLKIGNFSDNFSNYISTPNKILRVFFPVKLGNSTEYFSGYRVQHNNLLGSYKGGLRYYPDVSEEESISLATWMTLKNSLVRLPLGGGKGGLDIDPRNYQKDDLKLITQSFIQEIYQNIGPFTDIPAPDMGTNSEIIDWMSEEYQNIQVDQQFGNATFTGKSLINGGSHGRLEATGQGVVNSITKHAELTNQNLSGKTAIVQGFGNVGFFTSKLLSNLGVRILAIGDIDGYIYNPNGLNFDNLEQLKDNGESIISYKECDIINKEDFFSIKNNITIPAALELQIDENIAKNLDTQLVVEAANGPTSYEADEILHNKNITVIPDILANSGGVIVSYYEWLQNLGNVRWSKEIINDNLKKKMDETVERTFQQYQEGDLTYRQVCYIDSLNHLHKNFMKL
jgi:glutamate dehydrogenase/leucine dehydrogenase